jgi:ABC-type dipeptide/oligopeptide/nickel transport system permease component/ABC-type transport system substrate-binding protein
VNKRPFLPLFGFVAAALGLTALLYVFGALFRGDVTAPPAPPAAADVAAVLAARKRADSLEGQPRVRITQQVDYGEGSRAAWWPKKEAPILAELVREGKLPPVAERVGPEPVVMAGVDGLGRYGGTWQRLASSYTDINTIQWRLSYPNLVRWSPLGEPLVPHLAKAWQASPDNRVFTFWLRRGMRWSDGQPFTADDLVYWYEYEVQYFKVPPPRMLRSGAGMGRVEKVDDYCVRFCFPQPNPLFPERVASQGNNFEDFSDYLTPAHYLRQYHPALGDQQLIARTMQALNLSTPVALYQRMKHYLNPEHPRLWPWIYHSYSSTPPYVFVRNPYYFAVDVRGNQLPYLDRLVLDIRPINLLGLAASSGEASMQDRHIRYEDHVLLMGEAKRNGYAVYDWFPATRSLFTIYPVINRTVDPARPETKWKHQLLNDRRFRQALSLAINRRDIIDAEFNGFGVPAQIDPGPDSGYYSEKLLQSYTEHDPARANRLLDRLGLTPRDNEGYRTFPDGTKMVWFLNLTDYTGNGPAQFVVDDWARVGICCLPRIRARVLFQAEKAALEHDFTVWMGESEFFPFSEPRNFVATNIESFFAPAYGMWYQRGGLFNDPLSHGPGAEEPPVEHPLQREMKILQQIDTAPDVQKRRELFSRIQEINAREVWHISICTPPPQLVVVKNGFRNVPGNAIFGSIYNTPGNAGLETYFWDDPADPPPVVAATKRAVVEIIPDPAARVPAVDAGGAGSTRWLTVGNLIRALILAVALLGIGLVAVRHPFVGRRLFLMVPTLLIVSIVVFVIVQLPPGDYLESRMLEYQMQGTEASIPQIEDLRRNFHLNESITKRYLRWTGFVWFTTFDARDTGLLQGNLGLSMEHNRSVNQIVGDRLLLTVVVTVAAILFTWVVALPAGLYSAVRPYSWGDHALTLFVFVGMSVPSFLFALVMVYLGKTWFGVNVSGLFSQEFATVHDWSWPKVVDLLKHLWLPVVVLGAGGAAGMVRVMRANLLDELKKPYVITARAKGLRPLKLLLKYPLRLALTPFISSLGSLFPQLVSGGAIVAIVLSLPMIGPVMLDALQTEDVYLAGSMLMVMSLLGVVGTLVSDLLLLWLDPRIRLTGRPP